MANEYDITMRQFNGTDYDSVFPKTVSQQVLINDNELASDLGIPDSSSVNTALASLVGAVKVATGTYTGAGNTSKAFTFDFVPKFGIIATTDAGVVADSNADGMFNSIIWIKGVTETSVNNGTTKYTTTIALSNNDKTITLSSTNATGVLDVSTNSYCYMFMG